MHATPTWCRSSNFGSSTSALRCVTTPMTLSAGMTSSSRFLLFCRPTFSGITVPGKTTMLRIGRIGSEFGIVSRWPLFPVRITVAVGERSMIWDSDILNRSQKPGARSQNCSSTGSWLQAPGFFLSLLRQLHPQQPVPMRREDLFVDDIVGELDFAAETAVVDFHQVHFYALALQIGFFGFGIGRHRPSAADLEPLVGHGELDLFFIHAGQVHADQVGALGFIKVHIRRPGFRGHEVVVALLKLVDELSHLSSKVSEWRRLIRANDGHGLSS